MSASSSGSRSGQRSARLQDVERRDVQSVHRLSLRSGRSARRPAIGRANENVEPAPSVELDPDPPAVLLDDVAGDGQAEAGPAAASPAAGPGRPCRSARRSRSWAARGMPTPWSVDRR